MKKPTKPRAIEPVANVPTPVNTAAPPGFAAPSLQNIREQALARQAHNSQVIAELDAWRKEIDATIAFLRAQDK